MTDFLFVDKLGNEWHFEQLAKLNDSATFVIRGTPLRFQVSGQLMHACVDLDKFMFLEAEQCICFYVEELRRKK